MSSPSPPDRWLPDIPERLLSEIVIRALAEDIGTGDITTLATVAGSALGRARIVSKAEGILAGLPVGGEVFRQVDSRIELTGGLPEGSTLRPGSVICELAGPVRGILTGERVALNFLQRLSGIATLTARFVALCAGTSARIVDTRKTTPGLRLLEKYAVMAGGGKNHRMGLYDAVLIKDNHIIASGGIVRAVQLARQHAPHTMSITVECESLAQVNEALGAGADILLLDNMEDQSRADAVRLARGRALTEASGGITEATAGQIAMSGVDILSVGALTHSAPSLDLSLDLCA